MTEPTYTLMYNMKLRQPGCVLLQAAAGATVLESPFWRLFDPETWNLNLVGMRLYRVTEAQLRDAARGSTHAF